MDYQKRFFFNLKKLYDDIDRWQPDVTLLSMEDGTKRKCHRIILCSASEYFRNLFSWSTSDTVKVYNGVTGETLDAILKYLYSGVFEVTVENVNDLLLAANYFSLSEIVNSCSAFIIYHLDLTSCIDVLLFAWQLDLATLLDAVTNFTAKNFTSVLKDSILKEQLQSLPVELVAKLLKSGELLLRDEKTNLPTRPAEREKRLLKFIQAYIETSKIPSQDISLLLSTVKWPLLNIFREEEFVLMEIAPRLDNGERVEELKSLLDVSHSNRLNKTVAHDSTIISTEKQVYGTHAYSCSELVASRVMTDGYTFGNVRTTFNPVSIICAENQYISRMDVILRRWDGHERRASVDLVGGFDIYISSPGMDPVRFHAGTPEEESRGGVHSVSLREGEHITRVTGRFGGMIDMLAFETSEKRTFGPYGGDGGAEVNVMGTIENYRKKNGGERIPLDSILVGITGREYKIGVNGSNDEKTISVTNVRFIFRQMLPPCDFLMANSESCERVAYPPDIEPLSLLE